MILSFHILIDVSSRFFEMELLVHGFILYAKWDFVHSSGKKKTIGMPKTPVVGIGFKEEVDTNFVQIFFLNPATGSLHEASYLWF